VTSRRATHRIASILAGRPARPAHPPELFSMSVAAVRAASIPRSLRRATLAAARDQALPLVDPRLR